MSKYAHAPTKIATISQSIGLSHRAPSETSTAKNRAAFNRVPTGESDQTSRIVTARLT
jgi:hypothetical protein